MSSQSKHKKEEVLKEIMAIFEHWPFSEIDQAVLMIPDSEKESGSDVIQINPKPKKVVKA